MSGFKVRGYDREASAKKRDYSLFAIVCEGTVREPEYFRPFMNSIDKLKVDIIEDKDGKRGSAPKKLLERAKEYITEVGLSEKDGDTLWFIVDVDKWPREQLEELNEYCLNIKNWNVVVSNPCFEIWLLYHKRTDLNTYDCSSSNKAKQTLHTIEPGGYFYLEYLPLLPEAVKNAKAKDTNKTHYMPNPKETKVYLLGEALLDKMGKPRFNIFASKFLPTLKLQIKKK
ncbi:RloB family protein [Dysgonomonas reticulitermitis]